MRLWLHFIWPMPSPTGKVQTCTCAPWHITGRLTSRGSPTKLSHSLGCRKAALKPHCFEAFFAFQSELFCGCFISTSSCASAFLSFEQLFPLPGVQLLSIFILPSQTKPVLLYCEDCSVPIATSPAPFWGHPGWAGLFKIPQGLGLSEFNFAARFSHEWSKNSIARA